MTHTGDTPRIYVACLACYNDGKLHGVWIDAADADEMEEAREAMQEECGHTDNDWAIHDYEGFHGITVSESANFSKLAELAKLLEEHGEAYAAYIEHTGNDWDDVTGFEEAYQGEYRDEKDFAGHLFDDLGYGSEMPSHLANYFDYDAFARDLFMGDYFMARGYVFRSL